MVNPYASWAPPIEDGGNELERRRRALAMWLAQRAGGQGMGALRGRSASAVGRTGGIGGHAPLPAMTYNPFFSQIAGRPGENFNLGGMLPNGVSQEAAGAVQAGTMGGHGLVGGPGVQPMPQPQGGASPRSLVGVSNPGQYTEEPSAPSQPIAPPDPGIWGTQDPINLNPPSAISSDPVASRTYANRFLSGIRRAY